MAEQHAEYALNRKLQNTTDASVWTDEFMKLAEAGMAIDWGTMVGWFANAIEVGREAGRQAGPHSDDGGGHRKWRGAEAELAAKRGEHALGWEVTQESDGVYLRRNGQVVNMATEVPLLVAEIERLRASIAVRYVWSGGRGTAVFEELR